MNNQKVSNRQLVYVVYYSTYGHIEKLARSICKGLERSGVNFKLYQVQETLSEEILKKMKAPEKAKDIPIIKPGDFNQADAFLFGYPARHGMIPAQVKHLFDSCGKLWKNKKLVNKYFGLFTSTGSLNGGQETVPFTSLTFYFHLGMCFVPLGCKAEKLEELTEVHGGSVFGCGTLSNDDDQRQPSHLEQEIAEFQGFDFGNFIKTINF